MLTKNAAAKDSWVDNKLHDIVIRVTNVILRIKQSENYPGRSNIKNSLSALHFCKFVENRTIVLPKHLGKRETYI